MATAAPGAMSIEEMLALPEDGLRHELLDGEHFVTPSPAWRHQRTVYSLAAALRPLTLLHHLVEVVISPADMRLGRPNTTVQPDIFLLHHQPGKRPEHWPESPVPFLVIEVLSPSTARRDRGVKRRAYLESGVAEYWIVDTEAETVERWRQDATNAEEAKQRLVFVFDNGFAGEIDLNRVWEELNR